jgi:tRNA(fMet)-specific endonuclease VapC
MNLLLDTNVLIHLIKDPSLRLLTNIINPDEKRLIVSIASIGELKSVALQNNWGEKKIQAMDSVLEKVSIVEINESLANTYAQIDAFSQRRNPSYSDYSFKTPRNMGKNDLLIAATAALLGLKLDY